MTKTTVKIEGMMCGHCEAHVNDAIRNALKVKSVSSSHTKGETEIISKEPLADDEIMKAIAPTGYKVLGISSEEFEKKGLFGKIN